MYKLMVSYDCGGDYVPDSESENINDLRPKMQDLDDQKLRWYLEKDGEPYSNEVCRIHQEILDFVAILRQKGVKK